MSKAPEENYTSAGPVGSLKKGWEAKEIPPRRQPQTASRRTWPGKGLGRINQDEEAVGTKVCPSLPAPDPLM